MRRFFQAVLCLLLVAATPAAAQNLEFARQDPAKIQTAEKCGECHVSEYEVWKKTPHATGFKTLHRREAAAEIAGKLGFQLIKRESLCLRCHYTPKVQNGQLRAVSGVSCESCHGAGRDWINVHNDYGGKGFDYKSETPEHRAERIAKSRELGMRRPSDLYPVAASCFGCHTVPEERLVNVGGHPAGSADFELVAWSQGEIRHNFIEAMRTGGKAENAERPIERKRLMYAAGRALELEYALRGVAAASETGTYLSAMIRRVRLATGEVRAIGRRAGSPEIDAMLDAVRGVKVGLGGRPALLAAAAAIGEATRRFLDGRDGTRLAALDPLVLGLAEDDVEEEETAAAVPETPGNATAAPAPQGSAGGPGAGPAAPGTAPAGTTAAAGGPQTSTARTQAVPAVGEIKTRIHPASKYQTIGPSKCTSCHRHAPQSEWWFSDPHFRSADPFFEQAPKNAQIARLYGIRPQDIARGDKLCMDCHGTVVSGKERREVSDGVSCEGCHGPAAQYVEPHQEGDKALGAQRPGYVAALKSGMAEVKDAAVAARVCTGCHYVTDQRLLSAGHPSGQGFDYVGGMAKMKHWEHPTPPASTLAAAFEAALGKRGAVPEVRLARLAGPAPAAAAAPGAGAAEESRPYRPQTPRARPAARRPIAAASGPGAPGPTAGAELPSVPGLPPFPQIDESTPVEEILLLLKRRLELLYQAVGGGNP